MSVKEIYFLATRLRQVVLRTAGATFFPRPKDAPAAPRSEEIYFLDPQKSPCCSSLIAEFTQRLPKNFNEAVGARHAANFAEVSEQFAAGGEYHGHSRQAQAEFACAVSLMLLIVQNLFRQIAKRIIHSEFVPPDFARQDFFQYFL